MQRLALRDRLNTKCDGSWEPSHAQACETMILDHTHPIPGGMTPRRSEEQKVHMSTPSSKQLPSVNQLAGRTVAEAEALVRLWDRAEDWTTPRIPPAQLKVLSLLRHRGPLKLSTLAAEFDAIPSSTSRLCDRLEASGLIRREVPRNNRREVWLSVTLEGSRRLDAFDSTRREDFSEVLELMSAPAQSALLDGLRAFRLASEEMREGRALEA